MKRLILGSLCLLVAATAMAQTVVQPKVKTATSFAIVIDQQSYDKAKVAVEAYRDVVEQDGVATYIVYGSWTSPQQIRDILQKLHADTRSPLEGAALVGDIPIPMIRDAQHLSSAFKMDQRRNWQQSSIPSDRFYDDFGLKFDFIKQDTVNPLMFYYSLSANSSQIIASDIYSGRIRPLERGKEDKYTQLENYLHKVVAERTTNKNNPIDNITSARGHGYNSESKAAWAGEQLALREQFPTTFKPGGRVRFMDFDNRFPMKNAYLNEILRPDLDLMLFHHHGSNYYQFINGYKKGSDPNTSIENLKLYLRSKIVSAVESGKTKEEAIEHYMKYLDVPLSWCEEAFDPEKIKADSLFNLTLDINVDDVLALAPNARMVMFDACFNGSFYRDQYIAGAYIFNDGKTIVTQANTVNTIQDKWPDEFIGLLAGGLRVGQWSKQVHFLETHIIGDPTYRFANTDLNFDINKALVLHSADSKYWLKLTNHNHPDVQSIAYRVLYLNNYPGLSAILRKVYNDSPYGVVRMEALSLLARIDDNNLIYMLPLAVNDSYELVRRVALEYICKNGSEELIPALVNSLLLDNTSERVHFKISNNVKMLNPNKVATEIRRQLALRPYYDTSVADNMLKTLARYGENEINSMNTIMDTTSEVKYKRQEIKLFRNHPAAQAIDNLLAFAADESRPIELREYALEALGWYTYSYRRADVVAGLRNIFNSDSDPQIKNEAIKSINRLTKP